MSSGSAHPVERDLGIVDTFYFVMPKFRRRGLASKGLEIVDDWLASTCSDLRRLQLFVMHANPGSEVVAEAAGYEREGVVVNQIPPVNGYGPRDAVVFGKRVS